MNEKFYLNELKESTVKKRVKLSEEYLEFLHEQGMANVAGRVVDIFLKGLEAQAKEREDGWKIYFSNLDKVHKAFYKKYSGKCTKKHGFMAGKDWQKKSGMFAQEMKHCMAMADVKATRSTLSYLKSKKGKCGSDKQCQMAYLKLKNRLEQQLNAKKEHLKKTEKSQFFKSNVQFRKKK